MATSGSVDYSLTGTTLLTEAYRLLGIVPLGDAMSANQGTQALTVANLMLKTWGANPRLWIKTEGSLALVAATASYNLTAARRVLSVRSRTSNIDLALTELCREEYFEIPSKTASGTPNSWYFDPQRADTGRTLYVWPVPTTAIAASTTLKYTYMRVIEDMDALANDFDVPQEWLEAVLYNVAVRLGRVFGVHQSDPAGFAEIKAEADRLYAILSAQDDETASVFLQPA